MTFAPGRTVLHRSWRGGRISFVQLTTVVADEERGLFLWLPVGASHWRIFSKDGRTHHDAPIDQLGDDAELRELSWSLRSCLMWKPAGEAVSVWWFFEGTAFTGWYVNLEEPGVRWDDGQAAGVDIADQALDIVVSPDYSWEWKDVNEFDAVTGHPMYWDEGGAETIRAQGERMVKLIEQRTFPFDGSWCDFRPDRAWPAGVLPDGWDRPRATNVDLVKGRV